MDCVGAGISLVEQFLGDMEVVAAAVHICDADHREVAGRDGPGAEEVVAAATRRAAAFGAAHQHVARPSGGHADGYRVRCDLPCLISVHDLDAHAALKQVQLESGICCEMVEMDATPVVKALLDAAEAVLGAGARKVLAAVLPEIRTISVKVAQSLAFDSMEEEDFAAFFKGITAWIGDHYAQVMLDDVRADYWRMVNGRQRWRAA